ncbi:hypothetical protein Tco_1533782 [Tanacetum coccineum]
MSARESALASRTESEPVQKDVRVCECSGCLLIERDSELDCDCGGWVSMNVRWYAGSEAHYAMSCTKYRRGGCVFRLSRVHSSITRQVDVSLEIHESREFSYYDHWKRARLSCRGGWNLGYVEFIIRSLVCRGFEMSGAWRADGCGTQGNVYQNGVESIDTIVSDQLLFNIVELKDKAFLRLSGSIKGSLRNSATVVLALTVSGADISSRADYDMENEEVKSCMYLCDVVTVMVSLWLSSSELTDYACFPVAIEVTVVLFRLERIVVERVNDEARERAVVEARNRIVVAAAANVN